MFLLIIVVWGVFGGLHFWLSPRDLMRPWPDVERLCPARAPFGGLAVNVGKTDPLQSRIQKAPCGAAAKKGETGTKVPAFAIGWRGPDGELGRLHSTTRPPAGLTTNFPKKRAPELWPEFGVANSVAFD